MRLTAKWPESLLKGCNWLFFGQQLLLFSVCLQTTHKETQTSVLSVAQVGVEDMQERAA